VLGLSYYEAAKDGGQWPVHSCVECGAEAFVLTGEPGGAVSDEMMWVCFACGYVLGYLRKTKAASPAIGATKLKDLKVPDADRFFTEAGHSLGKRSLVMIKSTRRRSIRRAQKHDLIGRNVAELADLPEGQPGRPSRAMTEEQAGAALQATRGTATGFTRVVRISKNAGQARPMRQPPPATSRAGRSRARTRPSPKPAPTWPTRPAARAAGRSAWTTPEPRSSVWRRCSSCRSPSACGPANSAD
jgi:hypothetical protein